MSRAIDIGGLLQSGLLSGAQLYNQQAARRQQAELARQQAEFQRRELDQRQIAMNDRAVQAEFERQQQLAAAQRLLDQEAADGAIFGAIRALGQPVMGPQQPGVMPPDPFAGIDGPTVGRASPRAQDAYARFAMNRDAAMQTRDRLENKYNFLKRLDLNKSLEEGDFWEMVNNGIEFEQDQVPYVVREQTDAGQASIRDAHLTALAGVMSKEELAQYATMDPRLFNVKWAPKLQNEAMRRLEAKAAMQSLQGLPGEVGQRARAVFGATGQMPSGTALFDAMAPAGTGQGMLTPFQRLQQIEQEYMAINAVKTDSGRMAAGLLSPPTEEENAAAKLPEGEFYNPPGWFNQWKDSKMAAARAKVAKWNEYQQARQAVVGASAAPAATSPDQDAAAINAFMQRFGVPPDPSNPQHVDAFAQIEAQMQGQ